jgi:parallel beta-helix repeat protein
MGGLAVGNYDGRTEGGLPVGAGKAFLYDVASDTFLDDIVFPEAASNAVYGIWHNGGTSYTICGGYSLAARNNLATAADQNDPIGQAFLVDYDTSNGLYGNWKSFSYPNGPTDASFLTHFQGVSGVEKGVYTLAATSARSGGDGKAIASIVTVRRQTDGSFGDAIWKDLSFPGATSAVATSVYGNALTGVAQGTGKPTPFQATFTTAFQLSNVIGGNRGNGVAFYGGSGNQVAMNFIGTNAAGTIAVPNRAHGILITNGARANLIGGQATGGNSPVSDDPNVAPVFVRPPQGNLVSGNGGNGILVSNRATANALSGNYIGTTASGNAALGNALDGVAIVGANGNSLLGTTFRQNPFAFYNVLSGNKGNGLRITNSNDTTVQANFMGTGANNDVIVANGGNGLLASGSSQRTLLGGPFPLGNVISGNNGHGVELRNRVGSFTCFNTFVGLFAFGDAAPNKLNGIEITANGGNNLVRSCFVGGNLGNGIHLGGFARGVQIEDTLVGTNSAISAAVPNLKSGILVDGRANGNAIGGFRPSVDTQAYLSGNERYGIEIVGRAANNRIFNSTIGGGFLPGEAIPNGLGGIFVGSGTTGTQIGGVQPFMGNSVLFNKGIGINVVSSAGNAVLGNRVEANTDGGIVLTGVRNTRIGSLGGGGNTVLENGVNGIYVSGNSAGTTIVANSVTGSGSNGLLINAAPNLVVGGTITGEANTIVMSTGYGIYALGNCSNTKVIRNTLRENTAGAVNFTLATGITYVP